MLDGASILHFENKLIGCYRIQHVDWLIVDFHKSHMHISFLFVNLQLNREWRKNSTVARIEHKTYYYKLIFETLFHLIYLRYL